jgi:hypothetical protein
VGKNFISVIDDDESIRRTTTRLIELAGGQKQLPCENQKTRTRLHVSSLTYGCPA